MSRNLQAYWTGIHSTRISDNYKTEFMNAAEYANPSSVDGIHMDEENHQKLANAICTKVKKILY